MNYEEMQNKISKEQKSNQNKEKSKTIVGDWTSAMQVLRQDSNIERY